MPEGGGDRPVRILLHLARGLVLIAPAIVLVFAAVPRLQSGLAIDAVYPVPVMMVIGADLPQTSYNDAGTILSTAGAADGNAILLRAEALSLMQPKPAGTEALIEEGLSKSPTSVRGWTLLAEGLQGADRVRAAQALEQSLLLGPYEYYVAVRRARLAALLWDELPNEARPMALRQMRLLWQEPTLNAGILRLLATDGGANLIARSFQDEPDEVRAINRWVTAERRRQGR
jgi:hypothetical protein